MRAEEGELMERAWTEVKERYRGYVMDEKLKQEYMVKGKYAKYKP